LSFPQDTAEEKKGKKVDGEKKEHLHLSVGQPPGQIHKGRYRKKRRGREEGGVARSAVATDVAAVRGIPANDETERKRRK